MAEGASSGPFDELLECPLCKEQCHNPRGLPCQHVFCTTCLEGLIRNAGYPDRMACPLCREEVETPEGGADGFPIGYLTNKLSEVLQRQNLRQKCSRHARQVELHCDVCNETLCVHCVSQHEGHTLISLEELRTRLIQPLTENKVSLSLRIKEYKNRIHEVTESKVKYEQTAEKQMKALVNHGARVLNKVQQGIAEMQKRIHTKNAKVMREFETLEASMTSDMDRLYQSINEIEGKLGDIDQLPATIDLEVYKQTLQQLQPTHEVPERSIVINFASIDHLTIKLLIGELQPVDVASEKTAPTQVTQPEAENAEDSYCSPQASIPKCSQWMCKNPAGHHGYCQACWWKIDQGKQPFRPKRDDGNS